MTLNRQLLVDVKFDAVRKFDALAQSAEGLEIVNVNDGSNHPAIFEGIRYALVWKPEESLFSRLPDLEVIFSVGAGVDHIFAGGDVPDVPIVRFVDHTLTTRMSEWVCLQCLAHLRQQRRYDAQQRRHLWHELPQPEASEVNIGIMGMGVLGQDAARKLRMLGFKVSGWSRSRKDIEGISCYSGDELNAFLADTHFLVGLLPLTTHTTGIFNRSVFGKLARHPEIPSPVFINGGRGGSQVESDIISCLEDGTLGGVSLDVFESEPLPKNSPLWDFENALLTPHSAAVSDIAALGRLVSEQVKRHEGGKPLENVVDRNLGY